MTTPLRAVMVLAMVTAVSACGDAPDQPATSGDESSDAAAVPTWVEDVAAVANAIEAQPAAADSILAAHDMTRVTFDSLIYEVAADSALTAAYEQARRR